MTLRLEPHAEGVVLLVKAHPGARKNALRGVHDGHLRVAVTAPPEKGKANQAILALLAEKLALKRAQIELLAGDTANKKRILLRGVKIEDVARTLGGEANDE